ncbi:uncharacterized protein G2W53_011190 [Senna tora]|uniref:Uncharacterized protein n=1 Tax=Senna tora TaxID=362788 RepID=A0A834X1A1_9FABA|nr:uncharacterized protein G2W53_011190 [Senna tora]
MSRTPRRIRIRRALIQNLRMRVVSSKPYSSMVLGVESLNGIGVGKWLSALSSSGSNSFSAFME